MIIANYDVLITYWIYLYENKSFAVRRACHLFMKNLKQFQSFFCLHFDFDVEVRYIKSAIN